MAGHSKFKNIMHRKGAQDKKRSALFSKLAREITVAAKMGLPDPDANARLRAAVNAAKAQSMPKDNIQRAIDKASGGEGENYEEIRYEGYGSVSHGFERLGQILYPASAGDADTVFEAALDAGADDVESSDEGHEIWTSVENLHPVAKALEAKLGEAEGVKLAWRPTVKSEIADEATAQSLFKLIDTLDDDDDVQTVWGNYEIPDAVMEKLG